MRSSPFPRLLAISSGAGDPEALERWAADVAAAGVPALQLREKTMSDRGLMTALRRLRAAAGDLLLVLNRRPDLALAGAADGVHLPADGLPTAAVRRRFGTSLWIGRSTHDLDEVETARAEGADYVVFGPVFPTPTKGAALGLGALREAVRAARSLPVLALGGVAPEHWDAVRACGAWGVAGIRAFSSAAAARALVVEAAP